MKVRNGFVSNSSSSSFVVNIKSKDKNPHFKNTIPEDCYTPKEEIGEVFSLKENPKYLVLPSKKGKYEFGWEEERTYGIINKLNYLAIQILNLGKEDSYHYQEMVLEALESVDKDIRVFWDYNAVMWDSATKFAHIDHQSLGREYIKDIFKSVESVKNFIFNDDAYIQGGNDNGGNDSDEYNDSLVKVYGSLYQIHRIHEEYEPEDSDESDIKTPIVEGTCKDCGSNVTFQLSWYKEDGSSFSNFQDQLAYYGMTQEEYFKINGFGYYRCSNPKCKNNERTFVTEENCDSRHIPYINWNKNILGINIKEKQVF